MKSFFTSMPLVFLFITANASLAQIPNTDVYLTDYEMKAGKLTFGLVHNLTNRPGYDNQPFFLPDGKGLLFTVIAADGQADIYKCDFAGYQLVQITRTPESEYSPTIMPNGKHFSVVRVEKDSTQRLWKFPLAGGSPSLVLEKVKPVGYHAWLDANTLALFVLGSPNTLQIADVRTGETKTVSGNIGRALHKIPRRNAFSFVHKIKEEFWSITVYDLSANKSEVLIKTLPGSEDCAWTPEGLLLSASGAKLYQWNPKSKEEWIELVNFEKLNVKNITRLAVSPKGNRLAFVASDQHGN
jgi:Tol biopolymer transport system component